MIYSKWDIVLVPFPFTDLSSVEKRPALIISPNEYNREGELIITFVTGQIKVNRRMGDFKIEAWKAPGYQNLPLSG